ncbi:extracellular solute-binding protein [Pusillimonas noertemannii]|nr:extracellular solute-binding protein [Pusillimonas noertemannii]
MKMQRLKSFVCVLAVCVLPAFPAMAAQSPSIQSLLDSQKGDRQALIEQAQKEGTLTVYTSIANAVAQKLKADFEKKYDVKVNLWRAGDRSILQRLGSEAQAGKPGADIVNMGTLEMEMLHRDKMLQPVSSPLQDGLITGSIAPHKEWVSTFVNPVVQAYNTGIIRKEDLPQSYKDLLDPKWKGKLGIEATDEEWFSSVVNSMGEEAGLKYFRNLVAGNGLSVRNGHSLLNNLVAAGEVPLGLTVYGHSVISAQKKGAPIDYVLLQPRVAVSFSMGVAAKPRHSHAALLFYEYMLTDGQQVFAQSNYVPTRKNIETPFSNVEFTIVDKAEFLDEFDKWNELWQEIIVKRQ